MNFNIYEYIQKDGSIRLPAGQIQEDFYREIHAYTERTGEDLHAMAIGNLKDIPENFHSVTGISIEFYPSRITDDGEDYEASRAYVCSLRAPVSQLEKAQILHAIFAYSSVTQQNWNVIFQTRQENGKISTETWSFSSILKFITEAYQNEGIGHQDTR
ncbi:hypothetical protein LRY60_05805 [Candidatus Woesebacteria bacterium]|nr:hypothetical protein [Candidatus Woesebacteria bacterium]